MSVNNIRKKLKILELKVCIFSKTYNAINVAPVVAGRLKYYREVITHKLHTTQYNVSLEL